MATKRNQKRQKRSRKNKRGGVLGPLGPKLEFDNKMNCRLYWHFNDQAECDKNAPGTNIKRTQMFNYPGMVKSRFNGVTSRGDTYPYSMGQTIKEGVY